MIYLKQDYNEKSYLYRIFFKGIVICILYSESTPLQGWSLAEYQWLRLTKKLMISPLLYFFKLECMYQKEL